ncbi:MAG: arginyl-tRNA synthetase [Paraperlucidibaca sp.]|jgi:arginyl-tRNA synthetase|tara:strand:- start:2568 stop:2870 length:303 start_codon:yes stop_codon:yes gene_type:complete
MERVMVDIDAYQKKLTAQLNEWKAQADLLKARAEGAGADLQLELNKQIENLKGLQADAQSKFEAMRNVGEDKANEFKSMVDGMVGEIGSTLKSIGSRLKK